MPFGEEVTAYSQAEEIHADCVQGKGLRLQQGGRRLCGRIYRVPMPHERHMGRQIV